MGRSQWLGVAPAPCPFSLPYVHHFGVTSASGSSPWGWAGGVGLQTPLGVPRWVQAQCWKPSGWRPSCCWLLLVHKGICREPKREFWDGSAQPGCCRGGGCGAGSRSLRSWRGGTQFYVSRGLWWPGEHLQPLPQGDPALLVANPTSRCPRVGVSTVSFGASDLWHPAPVVPGGDTRRGHEGDLGPHPTTERGSHSLVLRWHRKNHISFIP